MAALKVAYPGLGAARDLGHVLGGGIGDTPRPTWQARASRAAKASDLREENRNVFLLTNLCHVPSSLVRMGVSRLKAGSFLKMPSLHLL